MNLILFLNKSWLYMQTNVCFGLLFSEMGYIQGSKCKKDDYISMVIFYKLIFYGRLICPYPAGVYPHVRVVRPTLLGPCRRKFYIICLVMLFRFKNFLFPGFLIFLTFQGQFPTLRPKSNGNSRS